MGASCGSPPSYWPEIQAERPPLSRIPHLTLTAFCDNKRTGATTAWRRCRRVSGAPESGCLAPKVIFPGGMVILSGWNGRREREECMADQAVSKKTCDFRAGRHGHGWAWRGIAD